jgi:ADP-ribosylglycohydrolase
MFCVGWFGLVLTHIAIAGRATRIGAIRHRHDAAVSAAVAVASAYVNQCKIKNQPPIDVSLSYDFS